MGLHRRLAPALPRICRRIVFPLLALYTVAIDPPFAPMDWKPMLNWILQGVIVAVCAFAGVYLALWLFARQRHETAPLQEPVSGTRGPETRVQPPALAASSVMATAETTAYALPPLPPAPTFPAEMPARTAVGGTPTGGATGGRGGKPVATPVARPDRSRLRHAFEFEDDQLAILLEMPLVMLQDDAALAEAWVEVVGWARAEQMRPAGIPSAATATAPAPTRTPIAGAAAAPPPFADGGSAQFQAQLDAVLLRLQSSAGRRRQMRQMLDQTLPADEARG